MFVHLAEREIGFHPTTLGFPSIETCMAIVLVTPGGLYGFHNLGGNDPTQFPDKANAFYTGIGMITGHIMPAATRLYGITHVGIRHTSKARWKAELIAFANRLAYNGRISGYDLDDFPGGGRSHYVEFRARGDKCDAYVQNWDGLGFTKGANPWGGNLLYAKPTPGGTVVGPSPAQIFLTIAATPALTKISKTKLR